MIGLGESFSSKLFNLDYDERYRESQLDLCGFSKRRRKMLISDENSAGSVRVFVGQAVRLP
jgi:hypothetical protein